MTKPNEFDEALRKVVGKIYNLGYADGQADRIPCSDDFPMVFDSAVTAIKQEIVERRPKKEAEWGEYTAGFNNALAEWSEAMNLEEE